MVTPFAEDESVDEGAARKLARYLIENGSHGLVLSGTTGESPTLSDDEKISLLRTIRDELGPKALLICGTGTNDTRHSERLSAAAADAGADAVLVVTPYYNKPNPAGIKAHFKAVASAAGVPVLLYNIPSRAVVNLPPALLAELAKIENVVGVKQANDDELQPIDGLIVLAGNDGTFLRTLEMGEPGGILVASHLVGPEMRKIYDSVQAGDLEARPVDRREASAPLRGAQRHQPDPGEDSAGVAGHHLGACPSADRRGRQPTAGGGPAGVGGAGTPDCDGRLA